MTKGLRRLVVELRRTAQEASEMNPIDPEYIELIARRFETQCEQIEEGIAE